MNSHLRGLIKSLLGAMTLVIMLAACGSITASTTEIAVQPPQPTSTLEPTFTPSPSPTDVPTPLPTTTIEPTPTPFPQASLSGQILDQETGQPIRGAKVSAGTTTSTTDATGGYTLTGLAPGQYILSVTHDGYDPGLSAIFTLSAGQELELDLLLFAPDTSPYPQDPMLTNPLDPNGAPTKKDAERLAREQGLTGQVVSIEETKLQGKYLVNYKRHDIVRAAVAELNHEAWELTDEAGHRWWIIKVCGNLASSLPQQIVVATPKPRPLPPLAEVVDRVSVKGCAADGCTEVGTVERGVQVEVFGCLADGSWCEVSWSGGRGWCTGQSLRQLAVAGGVPVVEAVLPTATPGVVAAGEGKIVFSGCEVGSYSDICVINPDGSGLTPLTNDRNYDTDPAWSLDKKRIAFSRDYDIYVMSSDGSGMTPLTNSPDTLDMAPTWSPDGRRIAFCSQQHDGKQSIYVMNVDGSGLTHLTDAGCFPDWSPDGTRIAFGNSGIQVMNADGSNLMRFTDRGVAPNWSPDSQKLTFFDTFTDRSAGVFVINADGSALTRLTNRPDFDSWPAWSPDGRQIVFQSGSSGPLSIMNADGSGVTRLTDGLSPDW